MSQLGNLPSYQQLLAVYQSGYSAALASAKQNSPFGMSQQMQPVLQSPVQQMSPQMAAATPTAQTSPVASATPPAAPQAAAPLGASGVSLNAGGVAPAAHGQAGYLGTAAQNAFAYESVGQNATGTQQLSPVSLNAAGAPAAHGQAGYLGTAAQNAFAYESLGLNATGTQQVRPMVLG